MHFLTYLRQTQSSGLLCWADSPAGSRNIFLKLLHTFIRLFLITFSEFRKNDLALRSAALTYTILLSLVPILAMSTAVVKGLGGGDQLREVAYSYIDTLDQNTSPSINDSWFPESAAGAPPTAEEQGSSSLTAHLRDAADRLFAYVDKTNFATLGTFGVVGLFFSVILVLGNIEIAMNSIWHVRKSRSLVRKISDYLTLIVLMPISINVAFAASAFLKNPTLASKFQMIFPFIWLQTLILKLVPVFFIALTFYVIYIFFPNTKVHAAPALLGAFLAAILWFIVQNTYISLQVGVSNYNAIYGSFATLPLFLIWMYLGWLFVLGGAQVAYACQHLRSYRLLAVPAVPSQKLSAAFDIMDSVQKSFEENRAITAEDLISRHPNYSAALVRDVLEELTEAEVLYLATNHNRLLPAAPADTIDHRTIIRIILGTDTPDTPGGRSSEMALRAASAQSSASSAPGSLGTEPGSGNLQDGPRST